MPQITISYHSQKTLQALQDFAKYFNFVIEEQKPKGKKKVSSNIDNIIPGNPSIDITGLSEIFSNKNLDASQLRNALWKRN